MGVLLHTSLDLPGFVPTALGLLEPAPVARAAAAWVVGGLALAFLAALLRRRGPAGASWAEALRFEAVAFSPLLLRPVLSLLALASLAARPTYPFGFTLPVALTQDWGLAQDALALAAVVAAHRPRRAPRVPPPDALSIGLAAAIAYALLTPAWAWHWDGHPGNEPKTLRMAVALGHGLTLDVEGVTGPMEELRPSPALAAAGRALATAAGESGRMLGALASGPSAVGKGAIRATRMTRQTVRGKEGGVFHVLAPGPSLLLAPVLRLDRALNLWRGTQGRLGLTVLSWNALAGLLVAAVFLLVRDATGSPWTAALLAAGLSPLPPHVFYAWQFYPEMLGALGLAVAIRRLLFGRRWGDATALGLGLFVAFLPWLHQKFLPVWAVLCAMAVLRLVHEVASWRTLLLFLGPQALTLYLTALYNFAVTGSVRPDAMFLAWGPGGVSSRRVGLGLLGLFLDARYGLLPYVPLYALAAAGLVVSVRAGSGDAASGEAWRRGLRRLGLGLPAVAVYYLTVAAADNWSGAVCSLGRYLMPATPWAAALVGVAFVAARRSRAALALALFLATWSGALAVLLFRSPHAANDCALLLARSAFADGNAYLPNLFLRSWSEGAPGLLARVVAWLAAIALLALWWRRAAAGDGGDRPWRAVAGLSAVVLVAALVLESWPSRRGSANLGGLELKPGVVAFASGAVEEVEGSPGLLRLTGGRARLLVRAREPVAGLTLLLEGRGRVLAPGLPPVALEGRPAALRVPLGLLRELVGRQGVREDLSAQRLDVEVEAGHEVRLRLGS